MVNLPILNCQKLGEIPFFNSLQNEELEKIQGLLHLSSYSKNEVVFEENQPGDAFYILYSGSVKIVKDVNGKKETLNVLEKSGEFFGEMSLMENKPRSAGVMAAEDTELLVIEKNNFLRIVSQYPELLMKVAHALSNFIRQSDLKLIDVLKDKNWELEEAYRQLQATQAEIIRKERLELVGRLASSIMHDIKNPISTIKGYAQLMAEYDYPPEKMIRFNNIISMEIDRILLMTQELLSFAKGEGILVRDRVNLQQYIQESVDCQREELTPFNIKVDYIVKSVGDVAIDTGRFRRALDNIFNNAKDAMEKGGVLKIEIDCEKDKVILRITDDGCGMDEKVAARIFDEFFT
ncbi:cyclic nucleotide-binding domain-containing protein, partial [bacterium]|nr:cyclic nucleotide-binding domain-containing protein [bacterium]